MVNDKPTLHHMNNSQSQRILWLLEELAIPYNLILHTRNPPNTSNPFRSPPSLLYAGPYGKAPLLITSTQSIPESSAIATYLIRTYDNSDLFGLKNGNWIRDEVLVSICNTSLMRATGFLLFLDFGVIKNGESDRFDGPELRSILGDLERELGDGDYFMGNRPGRSDVLLEFPVSMCRHREWVDLKSEFPGLDKWLDRVYEREAWRRGLERGNGYDLSMFPKKPHN